MIPFAEAVADAGLVAPFPFEGEIGIESKSVSVSSGNSSRSSADLEVGSGEDTEEDAAAGFAAAGFAAGFVLVATAGFNFETGEPAVSFTGEAVFAPDDDAGFLRVVVVVGRTDEVVVGREGDAGLLGFATGFETGADFNGLFATGDAG